MKEKQQQRNTNTLPQKSTYQKFKISNKTLSEKLSDLQNQITSKYNNYISEASKLRSIQSQNIPIRPIKQFQISRQFQFTLYNHVNKSKLAITKLKSLTLKHQEINFLQLPNIQESQQRNYQQMCNSMRKSLDFSKIASTIEPTDISSRFYNNNSNRQYEQQITSLKEQIYRLNKLVHQKQNLNESNIVQNSPMIICEKIPIQQKQKISAFDLQQQSEILELKEKCKKYEVQIRGTDEKLYLYEAIFVNIYNLLIYQQKWLIPPIQEIKSAQYNELETKLRTLFSIISINKNNLLLLEKENIQLRKKIKTMMQNWNLIYLNQNNNADQDTQLKKSVIKNEYILHIPSRKKCLKQSNPEDEKLSELSKLKMAQLAKITKLYEQKISQKYKQISQLKEKMKRLRVELQNNIYAKHNQKTIIIKQQITEQDMPNKQNNFTKRTFVRKKHTHKITENSKRANSSRSFVQHSISSTISPKVVQTQETEKQIILNLLKINKKIEKIKNPNRNSMSSISQQSSSDLSNQQRKNIEDLQQQNSGKTQQNNKQDNNRINRFNFCKKIKFTESTGQL